MNLSVNNDGSVSLYSKDLTYGVIQLDQSQCEYILAEMPKVITESRVKRLEYLKENLKRAQQMLADFPEIL